MKCENLLIHLQISFNHIMMTPFISQFVQKIVNIRISLAFIVCPLLSISCSNLEHNEADRFVGTYSISVTEQVVWGNDSGTLSGTGTLTITKISNTQVQGSGFLNSTGEIANSSIYFEAIQSSDTAGYSTTTFGPATLTGNVLTMTATSTGKLAYNGVLYPYRSSQQITGIRR